MTRSLAISDRAPARIRDQRLDFWRGLCLVDMVLVHLVIYGLAVHPLLFSTISEFTRFAAGGFVFVAGLSIGAIFLPRARDPARRWATYLQLLRRAGYVLLVHYAATVATMILAPMRGETLPPTYRVLLDILLLREGYDLLPFYVLMIAASPLLLELLRRGWWPVLVLASGGVFWIGSVHHGFLLYPIQQTFIPALWQALFTAGLLAGACLKHYDRLSLTIRRAVTCGLWLASLGLSLLAYGRTYWGLPVPIELAFWKWPLTWAEAARYLALTGAIFTTVDLLWSRIGESWISRIICQYGRRSLAVFVIHMWVVGQIIPLASRHNLGPVSPLIWMILALTILWLGAWMLDRIATMRWQLPTLELRPGRLVLPVCAAAAVATLAIAQQAQQAMEPLDVASAQLASAIEDDGTPSLAEPTASEPEPEALPATHDLDDVIGGVVG
jgi:hypothetical protein